MPTKEVRQCRFRAVVFNAKQYESSEQIVADTLIWPVVLSACCAEKYFIVSALKNA